MKVLDQVGANVRAERSRLGWTQTDAAKASGVSLATFQRIELGRSGRLDKLYAVADGLGVSILELIPTEKDPRTTGQSSGNGSRW